VKGITVDRSSNRVGAAEPLRPPMVVIGIIGGMAGCAPACAAGMALAPPNGMPAATALVEGAVRQL
jgi:hypothetical protein